MRICECLPLPRLCEGGDVHPGNTTPTVSAVRRIGLGIALCLSVAGCSAVADAKIAGDCKKRAERDNTPEAWAEAAEEEGLDKELAAMMAADAESMETGKAYDWATCMMDNGFTCAPFTKSNMSEPGALERMMSSDTPPGPCSSGNVSADNPFG